MIHTVAQALGLALVLIGAWLVAGLGGVLVAAGLALVAGSLVVEYASPTRPPNGGE